jgi:uncharacterized protein (DUF488 family)
MNPTQNPTTLRELITIGAYGFEEDTFFHSLTRHHVDTFVDIRRRRGVRGSQFAFANSRRLQARLAELGIRYVYAQELAPTAAVRQVQHDADATDKTPKRARVALSPAFVAAYQDQVLAGFSPAAWREQLPDDASVVALFCVERTPEACHRSLVAGRLSAVLGVPTRHVIPAEPPAET